MANNIDYFEIGSPDPDSSKAFYSGLFGWKIGPPSAPAQYSMIDENQGGLWDTTALGGENWAIFYVHVEDVQASLDQAQELGATHRQRANRIRAPRRPTRQPVRDLATQVLIVRASRGRSRVAS